MEFKPSIIQSSVSSGAPSQEDKDTRSLKTLSTDGLLTVKNNLEKTLQEETHPHKEQIASMLARVIAELDYRVRHGRK